MGRGVDPSLLKIVPMFSGLSDEALSKVAAILERRELAAGHILFNLGDPGDELFIVEKGGVSVFLPSMDDSDEDRAIYNFEEGELLGEMALIDGRPRSLSARVLEDGTQVLVLARDKFQELLSKYPEMAIAAMIGLSDRIRYTTDFLDEVGAWVSLVARGDFGSEFEPRGDYKERSIKDLAAEFTEAATRVRKLKENEEELRKEVEQLRLRIQIDEDKRKHQVDEIAETDYFKRLTQEAEDLRKRRALKAQQDG